MFFLYKTWTGKALRAVSQDREAAAIAGINPHRMNMLAFAMGGMIAALSGATLVQAFSWLPHVGLIPAMRSFVIVVLGGLGSLPGAFFGGIIIGLVEAAGTGCCTRSTKGLLLYSGLRDDCPDSHLTLTANRPDGSSFRQWNPW